MNKLYLVHNLAETKIINNAFPFKSVQQINTKPNIIDTNIFEFQMKIFINSSETYELIPCFSMISNELYSYQVKVNANIKSNNERAEAILVPVGESKDLFQKANCLTNGFLKDDVDLFLINNADFIELTFRINCSNTYKHINRLWLASACLAPLGKNKSEFDAPESTPVLDVPMKSQMLEQKNIRRRICSPTCVSMVIDYYGMNSSIQDIAKFSYNKKNDMYGIWPISIWAASIYGLSGYLYKFNDWDEAISLLRKRIPVIASINYKKGELSGAAIDKTPGHLVVLRGVDKNQVVVNDPASKTLNGVLRRYDFQQFTNIWLKKKALGYVLFK
jgi:peptidase C39-like protein